MRREPISPRLASLSLPERQVDVVGVVSKRRVKQRGVSRRLRATVVATAVGLMAICRVTAQSSGATEYEVKAAYLYNFGRFVEWPASASTDESFAICILGHDPFGQILDTTLTGLSIDRKAVVARRLARPQEAGRCRIVFISVSEAPQLKETLAALGGSGVLTVSDIPQFAQRGGAIEFVLAGNRVRFEINLTIAQSAGLVLSSDLLKVAIAVRKNVNTGD
jgi:hypothetical protein